MPEKVKDQLNPLTSHNFTDPDLFEPLRTRGQRDVDIIEAGLQQKEKAYNEQQNENLRC